MDKKDLFKEDASSREKIVENIKTNYFVEAGAGSGKTKSLVNRMVSMVENDIDIRKISAITFTKAAANEFYSRFQQRLIEESNNIKNPNRDKCLKALENIDLAFMGTIDSFCNMIVSEHPSECKIPSNATLIDDETKETIYKKEYTNILNGLYNDTELEEKASKFIKYDSYAEETFMKTLSMLLEHRDCKLNINKPEIDSIDALYEDEIKTVRKIVDVIVKHKEYLTAPKEEKLNEIYKAFVRYRNVFNSSWDNNVSTLLLAYKKTFGDAYFRLIPDDKVIQTLKEGYDYFSEHLNRGKVTWLELNKDKLPEIIESIENNRYDVTLDFVYSAKEKILSTLRKQGLLTYNDYLVYLRDTLKEDAENGGKLIRHIQERHKYYLVDEFQDTDPIQTEIIYYLTAEKIDVDWKKCKPFDGSLFIVGDPKQSIYRFKNADVSNYKKIEELFSKSAGEVLHLYKNFRSTSTLKEFFNNTFKVTLKETEDQAAFKDIPYDDDKDDKNFTGCYLYEVPRKNDDHTEQLTDEYKVKEIILKLVDNEKYKIKVKEKNGDKETEVYRKLKYSDFMVITPSKGTLSNYVKQFRDNSIPYYVEGNILFSESKVFNILVMFYGAVTNINDNRYLYGVLKSNLYGISIEEINKAKEDNFKFDLSIDNNETSSSKLNNAIKELKEYAEISKTLNPSSLFSKIIEKVNIFEKGGNKNMEYVFFVLESLKEKENNKEIVTHKQALNFFEKLLANPDIYERCPGLKKESDQVHLANLHKVKGLEAPVVILAHPTKKERKPEFRLERSEENIGYLFRVSKRLDNGASYNIIETNRYENEEDKEKESQEAENNRLAYVAATRAKNVLIVSMSMNKEGPSKENAWFDLIDKDLLKNNIEYELKDIKPEENKPKQIEYKELKKTNNVLEDNRKELIKENYELKNPSKLSHEIFIDADVSLKEEKIINESYGDTVSTLYGKMVHKMLEMLIISKDKLNKDDLINNIINEYTSDILDNDVYSKLSNVYDTLHNGGYVQKDGKKIDILNVMLNSSERYTEIPFTYLDSGSLWDGIIDAAYKDDNGWHIVDYKTNKSADNLDEIYLKQLNAYKDAFKKIINEDVIDTKIYHIDL